MITLLPMIRTSGTRASWFSGGYELKIGPATATGARTWTLPDSSGTIVLLEQGNVTFSSASGYIQQAGASGRRLRITGGGEIQYLAITGFEQYIRFNDAASSGQVFTLPDNFGGGEFALNGSGRSSSFWLSSTATTPFFVAQFSNSSTTLTSCTPQFSAYNSNSTAGAHTVLALSQDNGAGSKVGLGYVSASAPAGGGGYRVGEVAIGTANGSGGVVEGWRLTNTTFSLFGTTGVSGIRSATATANPGLILAGTTVTFDVTVTGAATAGTPDCNVTFSDATQYNLLIVKASVVSANTVRVYVSNPGVGNITPSSTTARVTVISF